MKRQVFFIDLSFRIAFLVCFRENVQFPSYVASYYCVVPVGKHSNSRSQMFYDALQNLAIFTRKHFCWRCFLINFIKKRQMFSCECCEMFKNSFSYRNLCEYEFFEYYAVIIFLQKRPCKAWLKITLPKNKSKQKL